jgi:glutaminyl-tRNA synthetase
MSEEETKPVDFIQEMVAADIAAGKNDGKVVTRFPPEPNGYLHIGHAKAICIDFGIAAAFNGECHLRMDDTNPAKESMEYVEAIKEDVKWLGFDWGDRFHFAIDYFDRMYECATQLIKQGDAYVCELSKDEWKEYRGAPTRPGKESPTRNSSVEENLDLFTRMREGEFEDGSRCLRAKIDMSSPNLHMRDPVIYRILRANHYRAGDKWCVYPTYDFAHPLEDSFEEITHSLCTLEFEVHRPLYDWCLEKLDLFRSRQIEFAPLNLTYTMTSKRKCLELVEKKLVDGWDDPRMPTLCGLRRRGYTPESIREFAKRVGVTKVESVTEVALLEHCIREELNKTANRVMAVQNPIKVVLTNYPEDQEDFIECINNPEDPDAGTRQVPFSRELYIESDDFMEEPVKKFFRMAPGREVRLRYGYIIMCNEVIKDDSGNITELHCTYDPETKSGGPNAKRKVKGTIHWVSASTAIPAEVRLYDRLFTFERPEEVEEGKSFTDYLNPDSLTVTTAMVEPVLADATPGSRVQFERRGYFVVDSSSDGAGKLVFNRIVSLRDTWSKINKK